MSRSAITTRRMAVRDFPYSLFLDNLDDEVNFGTTPFDFERTDPFSVSVWIKPSIYEGGEIISKSLNSGNFRGWVVRMQNAVRGDITFLLSSTATNRILVRTTVGVLTVGKWSHVLVTYDGGSLAAGVHIYVDGVDIPLTVTTNNLTETTLSPTAAACIGSRNSADVFFGGNVADTCLWGKELTQAEAEDVYYEGIIPTDDLLGRYLFDEGENTTLTDSSGNGNDGTIDGAVWTTDTPCKARSISDRRRSIQQIDYSLNFDGVNDVVDMGDVLDKASSDAFSLSFWVNCRANAVFSTLMNKTNGLDEGWRVLRSGVGVLDLEMEGLNTNRIRVSNTTPLIKGKWYHVVVTYDGSSTTGGIKWYLNGAQDASIVMVSQAIDEMSNTSPLRFGLSSLDTLDFIGLMADVRMHNVELTATQVANGYFDNNWASVEAHWDFSEGSGTALADSVGDNDGTIDGAVWTTDTPCKARTAIS